MKPAAASENCLLLWNFQTSCKHQMILQVLKIHEIFQSCGGFHRFIQNHFILFRPVSSLRARVQQQPFFFCLLTSEVRTTIRFYKIHWNVSVSRCLSDFTNHWLSSCSISRPLCALWFDSVFLVSSWSGSSRRVDPCWAPPSMTSCQRAAATPPPPDPSPPTQQVNSR